MSTKIYGLLLGLALAWAPSNPVHGQCSTTMCCQCHIYGDVGQCLSTTCTSNASGSCPAGQTLTTCNTGCAIASCSTFGSPQRCCQ